MTPLIILIAVFILSLLGIKLFTKHWDYILAGNITMSVMLTVTGIGHFIYQEGMIMMMPDFLPLKRELVIITGLLEFAAAIGVLIPRTRRLTGIMLIIFFILILPANITMALKHVHLQKANFEGDGPEYFWFRVPLQVLFIVWAWWFSVRKPAN